MSRKQVNAAIDAAVNKVITDASQSAQDETEEQKSKRKATAKERQQLDQFAISIRDLSEHLTKALKVCTVEALKIGGALRRAKPIFDNVNVGMGFKKYVTMRCGMSYTRAYNYMKLSEAADEDPRIKDLGLTEALVLLGLVKRKNIVKDMPAVAASGDVNPGSTEVAAAADGDGANEITTRRVGNVDLYLDRGTFVLELDQDWPKVLRDLVLDTKSLEPVLHEGGLLIRLLPPNPEFDDLHAAIAGHNNTASA